MVVHPGGTPEGGGSGCPAGGLMVSCRVSNGPPVQSIRERDRSTGRLFSFQCSPDQTKAVSKTFSLYGREPVGHSSIRSSPSFSLVQGLGGLLAGIYNVGPSGQTSGSFSGDEPKRRRGIPDSPGSGPSIFSLLSENPHYRNKSQYFRISSACLHGGNPVSFSRSRRDRLFRGEKRQQDLSHS